MRPEIDADLRLKMGETAVRAAHAVNYCGAGTVEFIMDTVTQEYFFMEMNTRLQVEHPVTEMVTGVDLVELQLRIASGFPLEITQDEVQCNGHSFEARIYAENPTQNFLPGSGPLVFMRTPTESETVRVETGVREGDTVTPFYDPMIAKLVVWGPDRESALDKLLHELENFQVAGLHTNIKFLKACANHPTFRKGDVTTDFIPDYYDGLMEQACETSVADRDLVIAAVATHFDAMKKAQGSSQDTPWNSLQGFRVNATRSTKIELGVEGSDNVEATIEWNDNASKHMNVTLSGSDAAFTVEDLTPSLGSTDTSEFLYRINGAKVSGRFALVNHSEVNVFSEGNSFIVTLPMASAELGVTADPNKVIAPMAGIVSKVMLKAGDAVKKGDEAVIMEAMKMELTFKVPRDGVVETVNVKQNDQVSEGAPLVVLAKED